MYKQLVGFGLLPKPRRSTAKILRLEFADSERFGKTVSIQNEEEDRKPCKNMTFSVELFPQSWLVPAKIRQKYDLNKEEILLSCNG